MFQKNNKLIFWDCLGNGWDVIVLDPNPYIPHCLPPNSKEKWIKVLFLNSKKEEVVPVSQLGRF